MSLQESTNWPPAARSFARKVENNGGESSRPFQQHPTYQQNGSNSQIPQRSGPPNNSRGRGGKGMISKDGNRDKVKPQRQFFTFDNKYTRKDVPCLPDFDVKNLKCEQSRTWAVTTSVASGKRTIEEIFKNLHKASAEMSQPLFDSTSQLYDFINTRSHLYHYSKSSSLVTNRGFGYTFGIRKIAHFVATHEHCTIGQLFAAYKKLDLVLPTFTREFFDDKHFVDDELRTVGEMCTLLRESHRDIFRFTGDSNDANCEIALNGAEAIPSLWRYDCGPQYPTTTAIYYDQSRTFSFVGYVVSCSKAYVKLMICGGTYYKCSVYTIPKNVEMLEHRLSNDFPCGTTAIVYAHISLNASCEFTATRIDNADTLWDRWQHRFKIDMGKELVDTVEKAASSVESMRVSVPIDDVHRQHETTIMSKAIEWDKKRVEHVDRVIADWNKLTFNNFLDMHHKLNFGIVQELFPLIGDFEEFFRSHPGLYLADFENQLLECRSAKDRSTANSFFELLSKYPGGLTIPSMQKLLKLGNGGDSLRVLCEGEFQKLLLSLEGVIKKIDIQGASFYVLNGAFDNVRKYFVPYIPQSLAM